MPVEVPMEKKICTSSSPCSDRLSNLPTQLINLILNYLTTKDVVRMSALARAWRYKWMSLSQLVFDASCVQPHYSEIKITEKYAEDANFINANFVNQVLMLHTGIKSRFEVRNYLAFGCNDVDRWILFLARKSQVEEFILVFSKPNPYKVPSSLFTCQSLMLLVLGRCVLSCPSQRDLMKGFSRLLSLELYSVTISNNTFECLVLNSPNLQKVKLHHCDGFNQLKVHAPNLEYFYVLGGGCGDDINFEHIPELKLACIGPSANGTQKSPSSGDYDTRSRSHEVLACLLNTQALMLFETFMEILSLGPISESFPYTFNRLSHIGLEMNFEDPREVSTALCLFRSSPRLQSLKMIHHNCKLLRLDKNFWEERQSAEEIIFPKLQRVHMNKFKGLQSELRFVQFILMKALLLETLNVRWDQKFVMGEPQKMHVLHEMIQFKRSSSGAKVVLLN